MKSLGATAPPTGLGVAIRPIYDHAGRLTHSVAVGADITVKREEAQKKQELQHKARGENEGT